LDATEYDSSLHFSSVYWILEFSFMGRGSSVYWILQNMIHA